MVDNATEKLLAEVDRLREDKARLDWLAASAEEALLECGLWTVGFMRDNIQTASSAPDLRAAIDAAMKEGK